MNKTRSTPPEKQGLGSIKTDNKQDSKRTKVWIWALIGVGVIISILSGMTSFQLTRRAVLFNQTGSFRANPQFIESLPTVEQDGGLTESEFPSNPSVPVNEPELATWDGISRVTILLLGLDYRDWSVGTDYSRSDTMILMTLDPLNKTAGILSIPRDLWVAIPGFRHGKINTAYYLGEAYKLPGGGPGLAVKTVEEFLGIPIHYYAQIDFGAFVDFIDVIGGVKIDVPEAITIDLLGSGSATKKTLQPGRQVLPGEWALAYARARYTEGGDFDRANRQQQVIMAIRDRVLSLDTLSTLISNKDNLYNQLASGVHTNLGLDEVMKLALLAAQVPDENIQRGVIDKSFVLFGRSPDDLSILIPLTDKIHVLRDEIFASSGALTPMTGGTKQERMAAENIHVRIYNASGTPDLDQTTVSYLLSMGVSADAGGNAENLQTLTRINDKIGAPFTLDFLVEQLNINAMQVDYSDDPTAGIGVEVWLGNDWAQNHPMR